MSAAVTFAIALSSCLIGRARLMDRTMVALDIAIANTLIDFLGPGGKDEERSRNVSCDIKRLWLQHLPAATERDVARMLRQLRDRDGFETLSACQRSGCSCHTLTPLHLSIAERLQPAAVHRPHRRRRRR